MIQHTMGEMAMIYIENGPVLAKDLADLRESVGWNRMEHCLEDPAMLSYYHIAVYHEACLIGYIDCVSNGVTDAYIQDLMIRPDFQGQGIGTELMNRMIAYLKEKHIFMISVVYDEALRSFYKRFGFLEMLCGQMETYECP